VIPPWTAEAVVILQHWKHSGRLARLKAIPWDRPAQRYDLVDLVLVLLAALTSRAPSLRGFYRNLDPVGPLLAAVWDRTQLPSRAHAAALFRTVPASVLAALDPLLPRS